MENLKNSVIEEARSYYKKCFDKSKYTQSHIWNKRSGNIDFLRKVIKNSKTPEMLENYLAKSDIYGISANDIGVYERMLYWHINLATKRGIRLGTERFKTPNLIRMLIYCQEIQSKIGAADFNILEIGGGNGQFARVAHETMGVKCINIDIIESLYCAYVYLRQYLPEKRILFITSEDQEFNLKDYDFVLCPVSFTDCLKGKNYDVAVNTCSFGEMNNEQIRQWIDLIENKLNVKYFFGVNRFLNIYSGEEFRKDENEASVLFDEQWKVLEWELEPDFTRCPYEDTRAARCLMVFFQRMNKAQELSFNHLQEIKYEDWYRFDGNLPIHSRINGQLVHDFTKDGTLFKLWESVRINKDFQSVYMMLQYLKFLRGYDVEYEEEYYYNRLLKEN